MRTFPIRITSFMLACLMLVALLPVSALLVSAEEPTTDTSQGEKKEAWETYYWDILDSYEAAGYADYDGEAVSFPLNKASVDGKAPTFKTYGDRNALVWAEDVETVSFQINVPTDAMYVIEMDYYAINDQSTDIQRSLKLDDQLICTEWNNLRFSRLFVDGGDVRVDVNGDESAPRMKQIFAWQTVKLADFNGYYNDPMKLYMTKGQHTLTFGIRGSQPMAIGGIRLVAPETVPSYADVKADYEANGYSEATQALPEIQGEASLYRSSASLRLDGDNDLSCEPSDKVNTKMNIVGGDSWKNSRQTIAWELDVPEDGLYKLAFHMYSYYNYGGVAYRELRIDGEVPFAEMQAYCFLPENKWRTETLSDADGEAYLFYLSKGKHELALTTVAGEMTQIIRQLDDDMETMSDLYLDITLITTSDPDVNYDYRLDERIPDLMDTLQSLRDRLAASAEILAEVCGNDKALTYSEMQNTIEDLDIFMEDVFEIPANLNDFTTMLSQYGNWVTALKVGTVSIDSLQVLPPSEEPTEKKVSLWDKISSGVLSFFSSFTKDYSAVLGSGEYDEEKTIIDVWFGGSQIQAAEIQDLIESSFVPQHDIQVKFKLTPVSQMATGVNAMLLALLSGTAPDAVLSAASISDYAMRGQCYDLSVFDDYKEISKRFPKAALVPLEYEGEVFGVPQTINFNMMYYRTDIFKELGLEVPKTWDEMIEQVIPKLAENSMTLAASPGYEAMLFQMGGDLYNEDMTESLVASQLSVEAFKKHCDFYTMHGVPKMANFFNRFRSGEQPIGFGGLDVYMQFVYAAPELDGRWSVSQIPGTTKANGEIDNTVYNVLASAAMIMAEAKHPEEAWEFLKWFTDVEPQVELSKQLEAKLDMSARVLSANTEAFAALDWDRDHLVEFEKTMHEAKSYPPVLGDYYTARYIGYAFNYVVMSKSMTEREAMEYAEENINKELKRRRENAS